jgi:flagellar basal-body rod modification protein FlgD
MAVDPTAASQASSSGPSTALGKSRLNDSFDTFLALLTTQLKNQDPLAPMDANQFTQQIVQMTGVEQQLLTNDLLQKLVSNTASGLETSLGLIGKQVRAATTDAALVDG